MVSTPGEIGAQVLVGERIGINRLYGAVRRDRGGLAGLVPLAKLLPPKLLLEDLLCALEPQRDLVLRRRPHRVEGEAVDVLRLEAVHEHPVEAGEMLGSPAEGVGMGLGPVTRHRPGKVHWVECPRARPGCLEAKPLR
jgi:hypothetical protein